MRRPEWLARETEGWEADGLITPEQRGKILNRYPPTENEQLTSLTLVWLAWLIAGFGLVLLVAWNWTGINAGLKVGATSAVAVGLYGFALLSAKKDSGRQAEALAFAGALALGAVAVALKEWFALPPASTFPMLMWALAIALTALFAASPITATLGAGVLVFWAMTETGRPPAPWPFVFVFPFLALALERRSQMYAAGAVTLSLGSCVFLIALDSWRESSVPSVMLLAVGSAIDAWAHLSEPRRPAFARVTPALAMIVIALAFQGAATMQGGGPPQLWVEPTIVVPALTLLASLTIVSLWPSSAQRQARWRPLMAGGYVLLWIGLSVFAGGQAPAPAPAWWTWTWTALPSIALVVLAVSAVREGVDVDNRGLFAVGVLAALALVIMHVTASAARFGRSAIVLFSAAAILWWISRTVRRAPALK